MNNKNDSLTINITPKSDNERNIIYSMIDIGSALSDISLDEGNDLLTNLNHQIDLLNVFDSICLESDFDVEFWDDKSGNKEIITISETCNEIKFYRSLLTSLLELVQLRVHLLAEEEMEKEERQRKIKEWQQQT